MKKYLILLLIPFLLGAAPSRQYTYTSGESILSEEVTANEDAIFDYLTAGVDTYSSESIVNANVATAANIQSGKLNLTNVTQDVLLNNEGNDTVLEINNDGTGHGTHIKQDGVLASNKYALYIETTADQSTSNFIKFKNANASSAANSIVFENDGVGTNLYLAQDEVLAGGNHGLYVVGLNGKAHVNADSALVKITQDEATSSEPALEIDNDGTGHGMYIHQNGVQSGGKYGLQVYSNVGQTAAGLINFHQDSISSNQEVVQIHNDGTGETLQLNNDNSGRTLQLDSPIAPAISFTPATTGIVSSAGGDMWFDGTNLKFKISDKIYNIDMTAE